MDSKGPVGIRIENSTDCHVEDCEFTGLGTAVEMEGGERNRVTRSHFAQNKTDIRISGGREHSLVGNFFHGRLPPKDQGLRAIRHQLRLPDTLPDREILVSLQAVLRVEDDRSRRDAAQESSLGKWLIDHGTDVNVAVNTLVTLATGVAQWFK